MAVRIPTITLTSDFGTKDHYVGTMKGVIYGINPEVHIVDISHEIAPQDILEAAFLLRSSYSHFPIRTIHVVVVDPTVGSTRKLLIVGTENYYFVAPDNGVLSLIYDVEPVSTVVEITAEHFFLNRVSKTFHGRDIMAPAAAWLSKGTGIENFGDPVTDYFRLALPKAKMLPDGNLKGNVIHVDRFGNLITNITREDYEQARTQSPGDAFKLTVGKQEIPKLNEFYAEGPKGTLLALFGSADFLEVAQTQGSAAKTLGLSRGAEVNVQLKP
jgi:S-adenosylmethionine hydrolase